MSEIIFIEIQQYNDIHQKHSLKEHRSKFKIDKITYSKSHYRTTNYVTKNKSSMHP